MTSTTIRLPSPVKLHDQESPAKKAKTDGRGKSELAVKGTSHDPQSLNQLQIRGSWDFSIPSNDAQVIESFYYRKSITGRDAGGFVSQSTVNIYRTIITRFMQWCVDRGLTLDDINRSHWDEYSSHLHTLGHSSGGRRHHLQHIKAFFAYLCSDEYGAPYLDKRNPFENVKKPPSTLQPEERFVYSNEAFTALLIHQPKDWLGVRNSALFWVARCSGMRKTELRTMRMANLHMAEEITTIAIEGKFGKWRELVIENAAIPYLKAYLELRVQRDPDHDYLWVQKDGKPMSNTAMNQLGKRNKDIVLPFYKGRGSRIDFWHAFRRTFAIDAVMMNISTRTIQFQFGWSSPAMIQHYTAALDSKFGQHQFANIFDQGGE